MEYISVFDPAFARFGRLLPGHDTQRLEEAMKRLPMPELGLRFQIAGWKTQIRQAAKELVSEINQKSSAHCGLYRGYSTQPKAMIRGRKKLVFGSSDFILLLADAGQKRRRRLTETDLTACLVPAGVLVELRDTTLHSTPIHTHDRDGCRVVVFAPRRSVRYKLRRSGKGSDAAQRRSFRLIRRLPDRIRTLCGTCYLKLHSAGRLHTLPDDF